MSVVYLSGPISLGGSCSESEISAFSTVFHNEAARLRQAGHTVLNPCETEGEPSWTWEDWMRHGIRQVVEADVIAILPRWHESRGAMLEAFVATQLKIPIVPVGDVA